MEYPEAHAKSQLRNGAYHPDGTILSQHKEKLAHQLKQSKETRTATHASRKALKPLMSYAGPVKFWAENHSKMVSFGYGMPHPEGTMGRWRADRCCSPGRELQSGRVSEKHMKIAIKWNLMKWFTGRVWNLERVEHHVHPRVDVFGGVPRHRVAEHEAQPLEEPVELGDDDRRQEEVERGLCRVGG
jgi:hypothetical protein